MLIVWSVLAAAVCSVPAVAAAAADADLATTAAPLRHVVRAAEVAHVIVLGDSISQGLGAESARRSYAGLLYRNDDIVYPQDAGRDLVHLFGPNLRYTNVAHSGDTSHDVRYEQLPRLMADPQEDPAGLGQQPQHGHVVVVMTVGGNDLQSALRPNPNFTGRLLDSSVQNVQAIMDFFQDKRRFPDGASIFFGNVYDITDGEDQAHACLAGLAFPGFSRALEIWGRAYNELAYRRHATFVDLVSLFHGHGFNYANPQNPYFDRKDPTLWVYDRDCVHPNNRGHHMLRRTFYQHISEAFRGRS
jgi:lysophospholipase L1-like esterase